MANKQTVAGVLAFLLELFPNREFSDKTLDAWMIVFGDWSDHDFTTCAHRAAKEPGRKFFPTPGEIAARCAPPPAIDTEALLSRISKLGSHDPRSGWIYPTADTIRASLGDAVADAYVNAGASQCFAQADSTGATISRDIARRRFADAIDAANLATPGGLRIPKLPAIPAFVAPEPPAAITSGDVPTELPPGPLSEALAPLVGIPVAAALTVDAKNVPDRPTITGFCDGCGKLKKVARYSDPKGGISWLCQEACAPKPHEIMRAIVENSPPPKDRVPNPAIDQWIEYVMPTDPADAENHAIDQAIVDADQQREGATP